MEDVVSSESYEPISLSLATQTRCDGSARAIIGKSEAVAGVYGPLESKSTSTNIEGVLEVSYKAHSVSVSAQEDADMGSMLKQAFETCLKSLPRTTTSLSVRVLAEEGSGFSAAVMAGVAALVDAGVPMTKVPVGIELVIGTAGLNFAPTIEERALARVRMYLIFCGEDEGPSTLISTGVCNRKEMTCALERSRERANAIRLEIESIFKEHFSKDKDLCI